MSRLDRLRWEISRVRRGRGQARASAYLDGELDAGEAAAFEAAREEDARTREYIEDIQFIAYGLKETLEADEPSRSFALTAADAAAPLPPVQREPAPRSLRLAAAGAAAAIAALAAVAAYDVLDRNEGDGLLELESAALPFTRVAEESQPEAALVADFELEEEAESAEEDATAMTVEDASAEAEPAADFAEEEAVEEEAQADAIDWRSREEAEAELAAAEEAEAEEQSASQARFAAQPAGADEEDALAADVAAGDEQVEQAAEAELEAAPTEEEADEAAMSAASGQADLEADVLEAEDGDLLMEGGPETDLFAESFEQGDPAWETPLQIALGVVAALAIAAVVWIRRTTGARSGGAGVAGRG